MSEECRKLILLGNEAIVRGALESGVAFATTYPGTPSSEIGTTFSTIAKKAGVYFEYSTNEKVALEAAAGASFSGLRSIVSMKHFGLNVASDSLLPVAYVGVKGGMVVMVSDDPSGWSSAQSEQDTRLYAVMGKIPMIEPSDPQEAKDFTKYAFELSEKFEIPVILRTTTRVSHTRGIVNFGKLIKNTRKGQFVKDFERYNNMPPAVIKLHEKIIEKDEKIREYFEESSLNFVVDGDKKSPFGIITCGVSFNYVVDSLKELKAKVPILKLSTTYPLPESKIKNFIKKFRSVLVVEELDPYLEREIERIAKGINPKLKIQGKAFLPTAGEYNVEKVMAGVGRFLNKKLPLDFDAHLRKFENIEIPKRFPVLCPGCPERAAFYAVKSVLGENAIYSGDIGCYMLGVYPPLEASDFLFSMGASEGIAHGISKATGQKVVAFIGDSTFFHAGISPLINTVYNKSNPLIIILDNRYTAMTGHQPTPGTGLTGMGEETKAIVIEDVVRACGVENVRVVNPFNLKQMQETVKEFYKSDKVSVIIAKAECRLIFVRTMKKSGKKIPKYQIDQNVCEKVGECLYHFGCPAIYIDEKGNFRIDENLCTGCSVCAQLCPKGAIRVVKNE